MIRRLATLAATVLLQAGTLHCSDAKGQLLPREPALVTPAESRFDDRQLLRAFGLDQAAPPAIQSSFTIGLDHLRAENGSRTDSIPFEALVELTRWGTRFKVFGAAHTKVKSKDGDLDGVGDLGLYVSQMLPGSTAWSASASVIIPSGSDVSGGHALQKVALKYVGPLWDLAFTAAVSVSHVDAAPQGVGSRVYAGLAKLKSILEPGRSLSAQFDTRHRAGRRNPQTLSFFYDHVLAPGFAASAGVSRGLVEGTRDTDLSLLLIYDF